ncbi:UNVERIFIED_CONTAM: hypothetical protein FKN15_071920 [Acipenser sinensis]
MLTEGSSDSSDEEDLRDESVDQTSAEVEGPALQDESVEQMSTETSTEVEGLTTTTQDTTTKQLARLLLALLSQAQERAKSSVADHYPLQNRTQHPPVKGLTPVCLLM